MSDFMLPDIGEGIVECEIVEWRVAEGDVIEEDQPVVEVMTDKALVEITAPEAGRITKLYVPKGEVAKVHAPLFAYEPADANGEAAASAPAAEPALAPEPEATPAAGASDAPAKDFILPDIGEGIVECEVVEWRIAEGETIAEDQPVVDVMTDKALVEITAPESGRVSQLHVPQGQVARVHAPLFAYVPDATAEESTREASPRPATREPAETDTATPRAGREPRPAVAAGYGPYGRIPAAPAVRRLLREHGLSLEEVPGSGKQGRVLKEDVLHYLEQGAAQGPTAERAEATAPVAASGESEVGEVRVEPLRGVRAVMAKRMVEAASNIPHFQYGEEIDVTELLALRERLKPQAEAKGTRLTLMPFFMKAMALAIDEAPILNARLDGDASEIHYLSTVNVGMAVDSRAGLLVPNVKHVERRTLLDVALEVERLTAAAREGRVDQADLKGGTISVSNIGALGGTYAAPIINAPELAIVAIGKTQWLPRFDEEDRVVKRAIMTVTWAGDHRVIDGGTIARFCNAWKGYLERPETMLLYLG